VEDTDRVGEYKMHYCQAQLIGEEKNNSWCRRKIEG